MNLSPSELAAPILAVIAERERIAALLGTRFITVIMSGGTKQQFIAAAYSVNSNHNLGQNMVKTVVPQSKS